MKPKLIPAVAAERLITGGPTGLIWENPVGKKLKPGDLAGSLKKTGYFYLKIEGLMLLNHRVVWFLETGEQPPEFLDHINGDRQDNRIENLRPATQRDNTYNRKVHSNSSSGIKGVFFNKRVGKWQAQCTADGKQNHLGYYTTPEEAAEAVARFREQHHGDFANHG